MKKHIFLTKILAGLALVGLLAGAGLAARGVWAQETAEGETFANGMVGGTFNPNYIISDEQMTDYTAMDLNGIQKFLDNRPGVLKNYTAGDVDGRIKTAAEIIYRVSQENKINPQVILVLLQKEQSLIENPKPSQYNLDWACGYHRPDGSDPDDPALQKYKGFTAQVDGAGGTLRWYIDHYPTPWLRLIGVPYDFDGVTVVPQNVATTALYNYTPHYQGNLNFRKKWEDYFLTIYPDGTLLTVSNENKIWLIQGGKRRPFLSMAAFASRYSLERVISISRADLEKYAEGTAIRFAQYSLVRNAENGKVYMIDEDEKRQIDSLETFRAIGFNWDEVTNVSSTDLGDYVDGERITKDSVYPTGALLQNRKTGGVYFVEAGVKKPIVDASILKIVFGKRKIIATTPEKLEVYTTGNYVKLDDGMLVKASESSAVYVIANGLKRPIVSGTVFEKLGYKWENIVKVPQKVLDMLHPTGEALTLNY